MGDMINTMSDILTSQEVCRFVVVPCSQKQWPRVQFPMVAEFSFLNHKTLG